MNILFFGFGLIVFFMATFSIYGMISKNKQTITYESESSTKCLYLDFRIEKAVYKNNTLSIYINNPSSGKYDISKITLKNGEKDYPKETTISIGDTKNIVFNNIDSLNNPIVYANECVGYEKTITII